MTLPPLDPPSDALKAAWADRSNLRVEGFLPAPLAERLRTLVAAQTYALKCGSSPLRFLYWESVLEPEPACDHALCRFRRWWHTEGLAWIEALTGVGLVPPPGGQLVATHYGKGSFLAPHNDFDGQRAIAFVLGLTPSAWPPAEGGHLEFLAVTDGEVEVAERRPPGWNTLDLFDVRRGGPVHRVPMVTRHHPRRAISGWFHAR